MTVKLEEKAGTLAGYLGKASSTVNGLTQQMYDFARAQLQENLSRRERLVKSAWYRRGDREYVGFVKDADELISFWQEKIKRYEGERFR